jgi:hypothetical protein
MERVSIELAGRARSAMAEEGVETVVDLVGAGGELEGLHAVVHGIELERSSVSWA